MTSQELTFPVPWGHVAAKSWGSDKNPPVLLVHGTLDNAGSFTRLVSLLPKEYYYLAIDLPGHGLSSHFPSGTCLDFFNYILTIQNVLDQLNWNKCMFIGHSFGAQLGVLYCIIHPNRISKLVALDGFISKSISGNNILTRIRELNEIILYELHDKKDRFYTKNEVLDALQNKRLFPLNKEAALALFDRSVTMVENSYKYNRDHRMKQFVYPCFTSEHYVELLKNLMTPTLVILASDSWFDKFKDQGFDLKNYRKIIPDCCTFMTVQGNHDVHNNNPERVVAPISFFLGSNIKSKL